MTILTNEETERVICHDPVRLWDAIQSQWAGDDRQRWKVLACIHLRLHCRWHFDMIGRAFGHPKGHVLRLINTGLLRLRNTYAQTVSGEESDSDVVRHHAEFARLTPEEIGRRIRYFEEEVSLWRSLQKLAGEAPPPQACGRRRVIAHSLRARMAEFLLADGPCHWRDVARRLDERFADVGKVLESCPEFYCDIEGNWHALPFPGQETLGVDVESLPAEPSPDESAA